ncbi:MAG: SGNH/GDSL hydrolase family protein [Planctomycetaceae bacterium]|nr:SGNH/GDSL hydrolase family protein [Planctomycetaceae bacterium]
MPREQFAKIWTSRKVLLLGLGDSVTAGFGVDRPYSYFSRLIKNPADEYDDMRAICLSAVAPRLEARNMAVSGSTSLMHVDTIRQRLEVQPNDVFGLVVMTTGGNDLIHNYGRSPAHEGAMYGATLEQARPWIANFAKRLDQMIELLRDRFPGGCMIFLADIYDPSDGVGDPASAWLPAWPDCMAIHRAYNDIIRRAAERHKSVHLAPMYDEFLGHGVHCTQFWREHYRADDPHYWYGVNLEDPNARGYDAIRRLFLIEIAKHADELSEKPRTPASSAKRQAAAAIP